MSGFRGRGRSQPSRKNSARDPPLIKLVEDYLCHNSHLSFINLDDMGENIRGNSFRCARMKLPVFKEQLKRAYESYCNTATEAVNDLSGDNIKIDNTPLTDETLKDMEGYPSESESESSNSDFEIQEETPLPSKDSGVNQMKDLYIPNKVDKKKESSIEKDLEDLANISGDFGVADQQLLNGSKEKQAVNSKENNDCQNAADSSTDVAMISGDITKNQTSQSNGSLTDVKPCDDESDVEIIEEVHRDRDRPLNFGGIVYDNDLINMPQQRNFGIQMESFRSTVSQHNFTETVGNNKVILYEIDAPKSGQSTGSINYNAEPTASSGRNPNVASRGVKRKPLRKSGDELSDAINNELSRKKLKKEVTVVQDTGYKLHDFAGSDKAVEEICKLLMHLKHPEIYETLGVTPPRGFLLHGPPGTGKTLLANAIAGELQLPMLKVAGTELVSGISGESESNIRELFNQARMVAPCVVFIDEIDSVTPRRENVNREMERRIVAQLLSCVDDLVNKENGNKVLLIGATNRIEAIDTALRRAGRFDKEICLGIPDEASREKILRVICQNLRLQPELRLEKLARLTPGYVGADLQALIREAAVQAVNRKLSENVINKANNRADLSDKMEIDENSKEKQSDDTEKLDDKRSENLNNEKIVKLPENSLEMDPMRWIKETAPLSLDDLKDLFIIMSDFEFALKNVQPSSKREGFATVPDTTWDDIGALQDIRDELQVSILGPVKHAEAFKELGLMTPAGVLLCGPPGCGKTLLAKAVANEAGINFISVKGPELLNMYVGESERAVRQCFLRARNSSPCVIFFDELDALCPRRSDVADSGSSGRIVNQLLTEMDGMESRQGVFVMAATNRPDILDPAILRPGRLDKILFVNLPTAKDRLEILKAITKTSTKPLLADDVNLEEISSSSECEDYTGADLAALVREASIAAFRELVLNRVESTEPTSKLKVHHRHFSVAFKKTKPSVGKDDRKKYKQMADKYSSIHK